MATKPPNGKTTHKNKTKPAAKHQEQSTNSEARTRESILADYRATFNPPHGQRTLAILKSSVGFGNPSFLSASPGQPYDPIAAAIRDGRKSVLSEIVAYLDTPEDIPGDDLPKGIIGTS